MELFCKCDIRSIEKNNFLIQIFLQNNSFCNNNNNRKQYKVWWSSCDRTAIIWKLQGVTPWLLEWGANVLTWGRQNYLGSKISRSQMCYLRFEICNGPDYLGSDISTILVIHNWWWRHNSEQILRTGFSEETLGLSNNKSTFDLVSGFLAVVFSQFCPNIIWKVTF